MKRGTTTKGRRSTCWINPNATIDQLLRSCCAWCLRQIPDRAPVFGINITLGGHPNLSDCAGGITSILIANRAVPAFVSDVGSPALEAGHHLGLMLCSGECTWRLREAVRRHFIVTVH
jgi:hypothetical protein